LTRKRKDDIMIKLSERSQGQAREREDLNARQRRFTEPGIERKKFFRKKTEKVLDKTEAV